MRRRLSIPSLFLMAALCLSWPASAQQGAAEEKSRQGVAFWDQGQLDQAAAAFREALVLHATARDYLNLCLVLEESGELGPALTACRAVSSAEGADEDKIGRSRQAISRIKARMRGEKKRAAPPGDAPLPPPPPPQPPAPASEAQPAAKQAPPPAEVVRYGGKIGLNIATLQSDTAIDTKPRPGVALGGFLSLRAGSHFAAVGEILMSRKGANFETSGPLGDVVDGSIELTYLEIPVLARLLVPLSSGTEIYAEAGPAVSLLLDATGTIDGTGETDIADATERFDVSLFLGGGVGFPLAEGALEIEARFELGFVDVDDTTPDPGTQQVEIYNRVFQLMVGYVF